MTTSTLSPADLLGTWQLLRCDPPLEIQPGTQMQFAPDNALTYLIPTAQGTLSVALRWSVQGGLLHTTHEDGSNPVSVPAAIGAAEVLAFDFGGPRAFYVRCT